MSFRRLRYLALSVLLLTGVGLMLIPQVHAGICNWNGNGTWETAGNWSCGHIPGTSDLAEIQSGTVTVTANEDPGGVFNQAAGATIIVNAGVTLACAPICFGGIANDGSIINYGTILNPIPIDNRGTITDCAGGAIPPGVTGIPVVNGGAACAAPTSSSPAGYPSPTIGGEMLPVNRLQVLLPWLVLIAVLSMVSVWTLILKPKRTR